MLALSLISSGLGARGSWAFGVAWATVGLTFTGVAAVAAQLTTTTRGAGAWAFGTLGVSYLLRAIGDTASGAAPGPSPGSHKREPALAGAARARHVCQLTAIAFHLLERRTLAGIVRPVLVRRAAGMSRWRGSPPASPAARSSAGW